MAQDTDLEEDVIADAGGKRSYSVPAAEKTLDLLEVMAGQPDGLTLTEIAALLGRSVLFCFDYILGSVAFYTTAAWGLGFAVFGLTLFLGGGLMPLAMLPDWLRAIVLNTPFAQAFYVPLSLLSGVAPLSAAPRLLLIQLVWLLGLAPLARLVYARAIRRVTVQGG